MHPPAPLSLPSTTPRPCASPGACGTRGPGPTPAARAAEVLRGSFRASAERPRPRDPQCPRRGGVCRTPMGAGAGSSGLAGSPSCRSALSRGEKEQPRGSARSPLPEASGPGAPSARSCFASRLCGQVQVQVPQSPASGLRSPPFPRGNLLARLGQANQTATPGAISPEECFDPALSPRRRGQIAMTNAGDPSRSLGQRCHRLI